MATAGVMLLKGPQARWYTQKAVHTQGGTHKRRSMATAGVMLLKGPQARRCTQKVVHTQGGTHKRRSVASEGVMLRGHRQGGTHRRQCAHKTLHTKLNTQKAVYGHRRSLVISIRGGGGLLVYGVSVQGGVTD